MPRLRVVQRLRSVYTTLRCAVCTATQAVLPKRTDQFLRVWNVFPS
jgi:hypothetical protein